MTLSEPWVRKTSCALDVTHAPPPQTHNTHGSPPLTLTALSARPPRKALNISCCIARTYALNESSSVANSTPWE
ncbi:hypothetical protein E2C01_008708 [Portunus trituberculatus]|uniref:Uncharacterized protein n=1 Tax=Portunus trituberculatus TaxID=210409 RepID=A0A5B7D4K3_PORTR|nr:hypothetical protein [Portunus trituberculatus]